MEEVMVFDTTLRDGEQSPGASLTVEEKLEIARQLERLKVDVMETGFPASSPGDFEAVRRIAQEVKTPVITALARALPSDIEKAGQALREAKHKRIHTFIATSSIHMKYKLRMSPRQVLSSAVEAVQLAKQFAPEVEFSPEDASRSDLAFLCEVIQAVIERGASVVNIPDTVGYCTPDDFGTLIGKICEKVPHLDRITLSVHCHNDLGMATANSIAGIKAGARQVECTINGIGERAGNASLEEIVMALVTRGDLLHFCTNVNTSEIYRTSRLVSRLTGIPVQPNKAIVGENAFRHEAGIHQDGVLKEAATYEIMTPDSIGLKEGELVLGKHSGRHAFKERMKKLGFRLDTHQLAAAFKNFKELTDKKREVFDEDLIFIGEEQTFHIPQVYVLEYIHTVTGNQILPTATVRIKKKDKVFQEAACGDGPIDAAYRAIDRVTRMKLNLLDYSLHSVTGGKDALGEVMVKVEAKGRMVTGRGVSTDIIEASAKAYLNAINRSIYREEKRSS
jgi:2-isopropylmalate synthase